MNWFSKKEEMNKIIFYDNLNNKALSVVIYDDKNSFDNIQITKEYDLDFINYIVDSLILTNDLMFITSNYLSKDLEYLLASKNIKVASYEYIVKPQCISTSLVKSSLKESEEKIFLDELNKKIIKNNKYYSPEDEPYLETKLEYDSFNYKTYKKDNNIIGMVCYKNTDKTIFVRSVFGTKLVIEEILADIGNTYNKDIMIYPTYTDDDLICAIEDLKGEFQSCLFIKK